MKSKTEEELLLLADGAGTVCRTNFNILLILY